MIASELKINGRYNWKNQPERLIYIGAKCYTRDIRPWYQFVKVDKPHVVWCEVLGSDLHMIEETPPEQSDAETKKGWVSLPVKPTPETIEKISQWFNIRCGEDVGFSPEDVYALIVSDACEVQDDLLRRRYSSLELENNAVWSLLRTARRIIGDNYAPEFVKAYDKLTKES